MLREKDVSKPDFSQRTEQHSLSPTPARLQQMQAVMPAALLYALPAAY
jgi:hypothetical protein